MKKRIIGLLLLAILPLTACGLAPATATPTATATIAPTFTPTMTMTPTSTPEPTFTPTPSPTAIPMELVASSELGAIELAVSLGCKQHSETEIPVVPGAAMKYLKRFSPFKDSIGWGATIEDGCVFGLEFASSAPDAPKIAVWYEDQSGAWHRIAIVP